jgi:choline dehydrogenase-like flavoprotein
MLGLHVPGKTSIADLRASGQDGKAREEVWGLAWHSAEKFPGLAYCIGGRSLFFGGWSPQPLPAELPSGQWPAALVNELESRYFQEASEQIGVSETNDFIHGPLHEALRQRLFDGVMDGAVTEAVPLAELPLNLKIPPGTTPAQRDLLKLEAPLAVQSQGPRSGFFPFNKFSAAPLLMKAARAAWIESLNDDVKKRLMVVPNCHVTRLKTDSGRVSEVLTNLGSIPVPEDGVVVLALGTIENARLALLSFQGGPGYERIGRNLMAHLRSNLNIRIPREAFGFDPIVRELQASALFLKGRHTFDDGAAGHFHLQITAAGLDARGSNSEVELFRKVPDIDGLEPFLAADDSHVVITLRGIGEMEPHNPQNQVRLDPERDEYGVQRAFVSIAPSPKDLALWEAMDRASDQVAGLLAGGLGYEVLTPQGAKAVAPGGDLREIFPYESRRDSLGTTHHEAGTLWMGEDPDGSVTDADGRFHHIANAYVAGPALFPTVGSPNPMLTGVALSRRTAERILERSSTPAPAPVEPGFVPLFDGTDSTFSQWTFAGQGSFALADGSLVAQPGGDLGLLYYNARNFGDYVLRLQFKLEQVGDNSGVFLRFQDPRLTPANGNPARDAVRTGFEVQIDELARGDPQSGIPDGLEEHRTGAIYDIPTGSVPGRQAYRRGPALAPGQWYNVEIKVEGDSYTVYLDNLLVSAFTNTDPLRGRSPVEDPGSGFIGLQTHTGRVAFRNVRIFEVQALVGRPRPRLIPALEPLEALVSG